MVKYLIARQLSGKHVISNDGASFGRVVDIDINEVTGKIESLIVEPDMDNPGIENLRSEDGLISIPYESVLAVSDYVIVDKHNLKPTI